MEVDVAADVIRRLDRARIGSVITGSEALPRYGEPRQTADLDLVLELDPGDFGRAAGGRGVAWIRSPARGASALTGVRNASLSALLAAWLAACAPVVQPVPGEAQPAPPMPGVAPPPGVPLAPDLAVDVVNRSPNDVEVEYEFEGDDMAGAGGGGALACQRSVLPFGDVQGDFAILVDGVEVGTGTVPPALPAEASLVVTVEIDPAGEARMGPIRVTANAPEPNGLALANCG